MKNANSKFSWRRIGPKKPGQGPVVTDDLLYIRMSVLCNELHKNGLTYSDLEHIFQNLGMNIQSWEIKLIIERYSK